MKKRAIFIFGTLAVLAIVAVAWACSKADASESESEVQQTEVITLTEALTSWDDTVLPPYPQGDSTKLTILKYVIPPHTNLARHFHPIMSFGYLIEGDLTVVSDEGKEKTFHAGETVVETVNTWHHGENRGNTPVVLVVSYNGTTTTPLVVKDGEGEPSDYQK